MSPRLLSSLGLSAAGMLTCVLLGCGSGAPNSGPPQKSAGPAAPPAGDAVNQKPGGEPQGSPAPRRKIIYTGTLDVVVGDLAAARAGVDKLLAKYEAYVAKSEVHADAGLGRTAKYTVRVPVDSFRQLVDGFLALGTPQRDETDSQDVTEEYVDVEARVKNLKAEEEALNKLLKESTTRDEVLKTREQIRAIRGDVERAQARLEYLGKLSALSTVNLTLREIKDYQPPAPPTFPSRVDKTFHASWESFVDFVQGVILFGVSLTPWLPVLVPVGVGGFWVVRKWWRVVNAPEPAPVRRAHPRRPAETVATHESPPPTPPAGPGAD